MKRIACVIAFGIFSIGSLHSGAQEQLRASIAHYCYDDSSYANFTEGFRHDGLGEPGQVDPVELLVTSLDGEPRDANQQLPCAFRLRMNQEGIKITAAGLAYTFSSGSSHGISNPKVLPEDFLPRRRRFTSDLPDDGHLLPPRGNRIVVQAVTNHGIEVRVYDRQNLPDEVIELVRVTDSQMRITAPEIVPTRRWDTEDLTQNPDFSPVLKSFRVLDLEASLTSDLGKVVTESLDGKLLAIARCPGEGCKIDIYRAGSSLSVSELTLAGSGRRALSIRHATFNPDGTLLFLCTSEHEFHLYDTKDGKQLSTSDIVPTGAIEYLLSPDWKRGLAIDADGKASLWSASTHRLIAHLKMTGKVQGASFSPQSNVLALTSDLIGYGPEPLTLWDARNGILLRKLWPVAWRSTPQDTPVWLDNGEFLVTWYRSYASGNGRGLWAVSTGKFLGTLAVPSCEGSGWIVENGHLFQTCSSGDAYEWNAKENFR